MHRCKRRTWSGSVLEQIVFKVPDRVQTKQAKPKKPRFETEADRELFNAEISHRKFVRIVNSTFSPTSYYSTLTFDVESEVHTVAECKRERDNFYRRLIRKYPEARIVIVYGKGQHTDRFHLHTITDGVPPEELGKLWGRGSVIDVRRMREHNYYKDEKTGELVDHGTDYTALASYLFSHWNKEFGGHRWKASRNCREPEQEAPTEAIREYSEKHPPVCPKGWILVEARATRYGFQYFKYVKQPEAERKRSRHIETL